MKLYITSEFKWDGQLFDSIRACIKAVSFKVKWNPSPGLFLNKNVLI